MTETAADTTHGDAGGSLGAELRAAREARKLPMHKAAQDMHVDDEILEALERDDYGSLGAPIFVRGHLRNYARLLGLSEDEVLSSYEHASSRLAPPPIITQRPGGSASGHRATLPLFSLGVVAVLVALAVIWWIYRAPSQSEVTLAQVAHTVPVKQGVTPPAAATLVTTMPVTRENVATKMPAQSRTKPEPNVSAVESGFDEKITSVTQGTAAVASRMPLTITEASVPPSQLTHAQFTVSQASWIEVYDAAGKRLFYNLAPAGDSLKISGAGPLQVFLGNAPGVSIELNGHHFNQAPFTQANNTARFKLSGNGANLGQAG